MRAWTAIVMLAPSFVQLALAVVSQNMRPHRGRADVQLRSSTSLPSEESILEALMDPKVSNETLLPLKRGEELLGPSHYEFGWEAGVMIPYAYAKVQSGKRVTTASCGDLSALYWFSPSHVNQRCRRNLNVWKSWYEVRRDQLMADNLALEQSRLWKAPPHKSHYAGMPFLPRLLLHKSTSSSILVLNKYTTEWNHGPVNYLSEAHLEWVFNEVSAKCPATQVVYVRNRILAKDPSAATNEMNSLGDFRLLGRHPNVRNFEDVLEASPELSFNEKLVRTMAKHSCSLSVQGGLNALALQFGGRQVVVHREGTETPGFYHRFQRMGDTTLTVVREHKRLASTVSDEFKKAVQGAFFADGCSACGLRPDHAVTATTMTTTETTTMTTTNTTTI